MKNTLLKSSILGGISVASRTVSGLCVNKVLAVTIGPTGYAVFSQFQNLTVFCTSLGSGALSTGVTKYTAEYLSRSQSPYRIWRAAGTAGCVCTAFVSLALLALAPGISAALLGSVGAPVAVYLLALTLPIAVSASLLQAVLLGTGQKGKYVATTVLMCGTAPFGAGIGALYGGTIGALVGFTVASVFGYITSLLIGRSVINLSDLVRTRNFRLEAKALSKYAGMAVVSAVTVPLVSMFVRDVVAATYGWDSAGKWQALVKIGETSQLLITSTLSVYYLPRLAELARPADIASEIAKLYRLVIPCAALIMAATWVWREQLIAALFSVDFIELARLMPWQLAGDAMRVCSWVVAYVMIGRGYSRLFVTTEVMFAIVYMLSVRLVSYRFGIEALPFVHFVCYSIYWVVVHFTVKWKLMQEAPHERSEVNNGVI